MGAMGKGPTGIFHLHAGEVSIKAVLPKGPPRPAAPPAYPSLQQPSLQSCASQPASMMCTPAYVVYPVCSSLPPCASQGALAKPLEGVLCTLICTLMCTLILGALAKPLEDVLLAPFLERLQGKGKGFSLIDGAKCAL